MVVVHGLHMYDLQKGERMMAWICTRCGARSKRRITEHSRTWKLISKGVVWHKCYEESLAPEWADAKLEKIKP